MKDYIAVHLLNDFSGSPLVLSNCVQSLIQEGYSVEILTSGKEGFLTSCDCRVTDIMYKRYTNKLTTLLSFLVCQLVLFGIVLRKTIFLSRSNKPKIIVNTILPCGAALAAKLTGCKVIYYIHETSIRPLLFKKILKYFVRVTADTTIFVSNYLQKNEGCSQNTDDEYVLHNSLALGASCTLSNSSSGLFTVFMPASLKAYKGIFQFVELAQMLESKQIEFVMALNADLEEFESFINQVVVPKNLTIVRRPEDINSLYGSASLVINLSDPKAWIETFGMTVIEAYSHGCPVITPPIGGIAEIVNEGVEGFKISVDDMQGIREKILLLANDLKLYEKMKENAANSSRKFGFKEYKKKLLEILE